MIFLVRRFGKLVSFSGFISYYLHSSLGRMGDCQSLRVVQLVLQVVITCVTFCFDIFVLILEPQKMVY